MPGAGAPIVDEPRSPMGRGGNSQPKPPPPKPKAAAPAAPAEKGRPAGFTGEPLAAHAKGQHREPAAKPPPQQQQAPGKAGPPKSAGLISSGDVLGYQGKLPVYVGRAADGNPMVDAEDARFTFDPKGQRVQLECKVVSIMMKAACLHLGLPPPDRGPKRFTVMALLKPEVIQKHHQKLFDGNLEVRLGAAEDGRPVLLDLTLYANIVMTPES